MSRRSSFVYASLRCTPATIALLASFAGTALPANAGAQHLGRGPEPVATLPISTRLAAQGPCDGLGNPTGRLSRPGPRALAGILA